MGSIPADSSIMVNLRSRGRGLTRAICFLISLVAASLKAAVVLTANTVAPATDLFDQFTFVDDAVIPGGTFNSQAFSDNAGPPGQTFTTPAGSNFSLLAFAFKGANTGSGNLGGNVQTGTWGIRVSSISGATLTPLLTMTGIPSPNPLVGTEWMTWAFSGGDILTLAPSASYAVEVFSSNGYYGFDAAINPASYPGGFAFNSTGTARAFSSDTTQDRGYDRTFHADLAAVPEPGVACVLGVGMCGFAFRRFRAGLTRS